MDRREHRCHAARRDAWSRALGVSQPASHGTAARRPPGADPAHRPGAADPPSRTAGDRTGRTSSRVSSADGAGHAPRPPRHKRSARVVGGVRHLVLDPGGPAMTPGAAYRDFWAGVGERFPDLEGAVSTRYYSDNERRLFTDYFPP